MRLRRLLHLTLLGLLLAVAGALVWLAATALRQAPATRFRLASGTEVQILGISHGTRHHRPGWGRLLPAALRERVERAMGQSRPGDYSVRVPAPVLMVWVNQNATNTIAAETLTLALADESGFFSGEPANVTLFGSSPRVSAHSFQVLPRRHQTLKLVAVEVGPSGRHQRIAELPFPNPAFRDCPHWKAQALPASQTNAGLTCTIRALKTGFGNSTSSTYVGGGTNPVVIHSWAGDDARNRAELTVGLVDTLASSNSWDITAIRVSDATGNVATNSSLSSSSYGGPETRYTFGPALWPGETWELGLTAARKPGSTFAPRELLTFSNVPLPAVNQTSRLDQVLSVGQTSVQLRSLLRRTPLPAESPGWSSGDLSELKLIVSNLPPDIRFTLVQATDSAGRVLEVPSWSWVHTEPCQAGYGFRRIDETATSLNLIFAIHPTREFTFRVRPEQASATDFTPNRE